MRKGIVIRIIGSGFAGPKEVEELLKRDCPVGPGARRLLGNPAYSQQCLADGQARCVVLVPEDGVWQVCGMGEEKPLASYVPRLYEVFDGKMRAMGIRKITCPHDPIEGKRLVLLCEGDESLFQHMEAIDVAP